MEMTKAINQLFIHCIINTGQFVLDLCVCVVCQFNFMNWIEVMDGLLDVRQSMLKFVDRVGTFKLNNFYHNISCVSHRSKLPVRKQRKTRTISYYTVTVISM